MSFWKLIQLPGGMKIIVYDESYGVFLQNFKKDLVRKTKAAVKDFFGPLAYGKTHYSQEGEDLLLMRFLGQKKQGFYVEVGCHHPHRFSNTYAFYRRGWSGICLDPRPGVKHEFSRWRPRDLVLEVGVSKRASELTYFMFNEPAINTFSRELAIERAGKNNWRIIEERKIPTLSLREILNQNLPSGATDIDFFSVDVEGLDLEVLESNDWQRYVPRFVVTECLNISLLDLQNDPVFKFLSAQGYIPLAKMANSVIFEKSR